MVILSLTTVTSMRLVDVRKVKVLGADKIALCRVQRVARLGFLVLITVVCLMIRGGRGRGSGESLDDVVTMI